MYKNQLQRYTNLKASLVDSTLSNFCTSFEAYKLNLASIVEMIQDEQTKTDFIKFLTKGKSKNQEEGHYSIENTDQA